MPGRNPLSFSNKTNFNPKTGQALILTLFNLLVPDSWYPPKMSFSFPFLIRHLSRFCSWFPGLSRGAMLVSFIQSRGLCRTYFLPQWCQSSHWIFFLLRSLITFIFCLIQVISYTSFLPHSCQCSHWFPVPGQLKSHVYSISLMSESTLISSHTHVSIRTDFLSHSCHNPHWFLLSLMS